MTPPPDRLSEIRPLLDDLNERFVEKDTGEWTFTVDADDDSEKAIMARHGAYGLTEITEWTGSDDNAELIVRTVNLAPRLIEDLLELDDQNGRIATALGETFEQLDQLKEAHRAAIRRAEEAEAALEHMRRIYQEEMEVCNYWRNLGMSVRGYAPTLIEDVLGAAEHGEFRRLHVREAARLLKLELERTAGSEGDSGAR